MDYGKITEHCDLTFLEVQDGVKSHTDDTCAIRTSKYVIAFSVDYFAALETLSGDYYTPSETNETYSNLEITDIEVRDHNDNLVEVDLDKAEEFIKENIKI